MTETLKKKAVAVNPCCAMIYTGSWSPHRACGSPGKFQQDSKWYCGVHNPAKNAKRQERRKLEGAIASWRPPRSRRSREH